MKKKLLAMLLCAVMLITCTACGEKTAEAAPAAPNTNSQQSSAPEAAKPADLPSYTWKFGHGNAPEDLVSVGAQEWADAVKAATDGRIEIEVYPSGQLGSITKMQEMVSMGTLDLCMVDLSAVGDMLGKMDIFAQPFMFADWEHVAAVVDGEVGQKLFDEFAEVSNIRILGIMWNGFRCFTTRVPVTKAEDLVGITTRSPNLDSYLNMFNTLGMNPVPIDWNEAYTAISTGVADAIDDSSEVIYKYDFYRYLDYMCKSNHIAGLVGPAIREDIWQSLSAEDQKLLKDEINKMLATQRAGIIENEDYYYGLLEDNGMTITKIEDRQSFVDVFTPSWSEFAKANDCEDLLADIMALA